MITFLIIEFQSRGLAHDHGLLWSKIVPSFVISTNEEIENFVDKYLTIDQNILNT
jgi:hypothetical protein